MKLHLNNTLTRKKEEFIPIEKNKVKIYSCWPTVYNYAHIWNLRSYIFPDILKKLLKHLWYQVQDMINFTDVWHLVSDWDTWEDKMEKSAREAWKNAWEISEFYSKAFEEDLRKLQIAFPWKFPKATDYIEEQIDLIRKLEEGWFTYTTSDWVYFDTDKFPEYWEMAKLKIEELEEWARVEVWEKRYKTDFALWKFSPENEKRQMEWKSPWWKGFPWWHLECTAMIFKELWNHIDIHTWWTDHIPVHHTNEIAQAQCATWEKYVNYWLHWEFLVLDKNEKMSKSEWNFITLNSLIEKWFNPLSYKYLALQNHYRSFLTFSFDILKSAEVSYLRLKESIRKIKRHSELVSKSSSLWVCNLENKISKKDDPEINSGWQASFYNNEVLKALCDDLSTPKALVLIRELIKDENISSKEKISTIKKYDEILWLNLLDFSDLEKEIEIPDEIKKLAEKRAQAKKDRNFELADKIRDEIKSKWFEVKDTREGFKINKI